MFFKLILIFGVLTKTIISSEIDTTNITIYTQEDLSDKLYYIQWEIKKRNYSAALHGLLEIIDQKPNNIIINTNIALCYYKIKDYEKALKHWSLFYEQKQYDNAASYASLALALALGIDRRCGNAQYIYGHSLCKIGSFVNYY